MPTISATSLLFRPKATRDAPNARVRSAARRRGGQVLKVAVEALPVFFRGSLAIAAPELYRCPLGDPSLAEYDGPPGGRSFTLDDRGNNVREFYSKLARPVRVGIEATGSMWFVNLMEELRIECLVGHPAKIRAAEPRKQKHDRRDADLILKLLVENRFPGIWLPSKEQQDLRALLRHRHQWVPMRTRNRMRCSR